LFLGHVNSLNVLHMSSTIGSKGESLYAHGHDNVFECGVVRDSD
jgi:hypothetical protein